MGRKEEREMDEGGELDAEVKKGNKSGEKKGTGINQEKGKGRKEGGEGNESGNKAGKNYEVE